MRDPISRLNQLCDELHNELHNELHDLSQNNANRQRLCHELNEVCRSIQARDALYTAMTANFPSGALALFTPDLRYKLVEGSGLDLIGMNKETMLERSIFEVFSAETVAMLEADHRAAIDGQASARVIERHGRSISLQTVPVDLNGQRLGLVVAQDVTVQKQNERELAMQALTDALTGLGNRRALELDLAGECSRADRHHYPLAVVSLDLDGLKAINDTHGHHRGDEYLQTFAAALRQHFRTGDRPYRLGGDEFVVLLPHAHATGKRSILAHIRNAIARVRQAGFQNANVSAGVAFYPIDTTEIHQLLELADQRMYRQKIEHHATTRGHSKGVSVAQID